jgi:soluble lytic murein transglycosylase-like protein
LALVAATLLHPASALAHPVDRWAAEIARASSRFGVPQSWIRRVIAVESGGVAVRNGRQIVSSAGAMGLMQLMPGTWRDMRALLGLGPDPYHPADNILAGTAYLRLMYDRFGYPGLFAAYNAGPQRYAAFLARGRPLPAETGAYVAAVAPAVARRTVPRLAKAQTSVPVAAPPAGLFALRASAGTAALTRLQPPRSAGLFVTLTAAPEQ